MKKIYWRPSGVSRSMMLMMTAFAIVGMLSVEVFKTNITQKLYKEKIKAAKLMESGVSLMGQKRAEVVGHIDLENDPTRSGLIGELMTEITSNAGVELVIGMALQLGARPLRSASTCSTWES